MVKLLKGAIQVFSDQFQTPLLRLRGSKASIPDQLGQHLKLEEGMKQFLSWTPVHSEGQGENVEVDAGGQQEGPGQTVEAMAGRPLGGVLQLV